MAREGDGGDGGDGPDGGLPSDVRIRCECGRWVEGAATDDALTCACGASYSLRVTRLDPGPTGGAQ